MNNNNNNRDGKEHDDSIICCSLVPGDGMTMEHDNNSIRMLVKTFGDDHDDYTMMMGLLPEP